MTIFAICILLALVLGAYLRPLLDDALDAWRNRRQHTLVRTRLGVTVCCPKVRVLMRQRRMGRWG